MALCKLKCEVLTKAADAVNLVGGKVDVHKRNCRKGARFIACVVVVAEERGRTC